VESTEDSQLNTKRFKVSALAAGLIAVFMAAVSNAEAAVLTVDSISAEWTNPVGGTSITNNGVQTNPGVAQIRWGEVPGSRPQSGFNFLGSAPGSFGVNEGEAFSLGTFTHLNNVIDDGPITAVRLDLNLTIGGTGVVGPFLTLFNFYESPNGCQPQPTCANDLASLSGIGTSTTFAVGDVTYALTILGFSQDGGLSFIDFLSTGEDHTQSAQLYAKVSAVPLPAAAWLFLSALSALGLSGWRRRKIA
jgi:hypothetical protein